MYNVFSHSSFIRAALALSPGLKLYFLSVLFVKLHLTVLYSNIKYSVREFLMAEAAKTGKNWAQRHGNKISIRAYASDNGDYLIGRHR